MVGPRRAVPFHDRGRAGVHRGEKLVHDAAHGPAVGQRSR